MCSSQQSRYLCITEEILESSQLFFIFIFSDSMPYHFKFKHYCPLVFQNLRERFGIDDNYYAVSISCHCLPLDSFAGYGTLGLITFIDLPQGPSLVKEFPG